MYYVYLLVNEKGGTYIGYTQDLKRRLAEHQNGVRGYTQRYEWHLAYYEAYQSKDDAQRRERRLKDGRAKDHLRRRAAASIEYFLA